MVMGETMHDWGGGMMKEGKVYGYAKVGEMPTYPGPTILVREDIPINITWHNNLSSPHILSAYVADYLLTGPASCYPSCGVPAIVHVHGMETAVSNDGSPLNTFGKGEMRNDYYPNSQLGATLFYHDHGYGITRLNVWAGLAGAYVIEGNNEEALNVSTNCDIPLLLQDKLISMNGSLLYSTTSMCMAKDMLPWVMEAYGNVNLVNGKVAPYVNIPQQQCRFRFINGANARMYMLDIPFYDKCQIIGTDSGLVKTPKRMMSSMDVTMYPAERIELMCDFTNVPNNTMYNLTNSNPMSSGMSEIMQFRVNMPSKRAPTTMPTILNNITNLQEMWASTPNAVEKNISMGQFNDANGCATQLILMENGIYLNSSAGATIQSVKGTVEKWNFMNPTMDVHPFHLHVVHMQCGNDNSNIDTNSLKDDVPIPISNMSDPSSITQICYVAIMPSKALLWNTIIQPDDFGFSTVDKYVAHCHILEHEDNDMMAFYQLVDAVTPPQVTPTTVSTSGKRFNANYLLLLLLLIPVLGLVAAIVKVRGYFTTGKGASLASKSQEMTDRKP